VKDLVTDAVGTLRYTCDSAGCFKTVIDAAGKIMVRKTVYDSDGNVHQKTDGAGNTTIYDYGLEDGIYPGLLNSTTYPTYTERYGNDARGRITSVTDELGPDQSRTTFTAYYTDGLLKSRGYVVSCGPATLTVNRC
jgi:hypothetical protein